MPAAVIDRDAKPIGHIPPYKRVDLSGRPRVITRKDILNDVHREPCSEAYDFEPYTGTWTLKD